MSRSNRRRNITAEQRDNQRAKRRASLNRRASDRAVKSADRNYR